MQVNLQKRIDALKTTALMGKREKMGPVELINWWGSFRTTARGVKIFEDLDSDVRAQILKWESEPYEVIGA